VGNHASSGFVPGFQHPFGGLDHILAMVAVGLWAAQLGGNARWALPLSFVGMMAIGGMVGTAGLSLPWVEPGILISDLILGAVILFSTRLPLPASMGVVGLLAVFHGYAHGAELPQGASALEFAAGFVCSTAFLHGLGLGIAVVMQKFWHESLVKAAGAVIFVSGLGLAIAASIS
jgi:urease accessory protein